MLTETPVDRALVTATRYEGSDPSLWQLDLGVHLHVGQPEAVGAHAVRVWLHTKDCRTRHAPQQLKGSLADHSDGRCLVCGALPLAYASVAPAKETWAAWFWRRAFGIQEAA